uniref:aspartate transaminase n=1 Tax=Laticauda laticaudata TaxID=8630 RepID=A0A8C5RSZ8_LATLA
MRACADSRHAQLDASRDIAEDAATECRRHGRCHTDNADEIWIPPVVQKILLKIPQDPTLDHEYLGELGIVEFTKTAMELVIGKNNQAFLDNRAGGVHTIGGTGAVWIGAEFLHRWYRTNHSTPVSLYFSGTLGCIFQVAGFADICSYHYWDPIKLSVDIDMFVAELQVPESNNLYPCLEQHSYSHLRRHLFPFFDVTAQGLASGDLDRDAWVVRLFVNKGFELFCAQSFSKTFGLYDERVGNLIVVTTDNQTLIRIHSQIARLITVTWLGPTSLGARVITMVLNSPSEFILAMRSSLCIIILGLYTLLAWYEGRQIKKLIKSFFRWRFCHL